MDLNERFNAAKPTNQAPRQEAASGRPLRRAGSNERTRKRPAGQEAARRREQLRKLREQRERKRKVLYTRLIIAGSVLLALILIYVLTAASYKKKFLPHTYINGFDVSGGSVADAEALLKDSVEDYELEVAFRGGRSELITSKDIGLTYVSSNEVQQLMDSQHRLSWPMSFFGKKTHAAVSTSFHFDSTLLRSFLEALPEFDEAQISSPRSSKIALNRDLTYRITDSYEGNRPNEDVIFEAVDTAVNASESRLSLELVDGAYYKPAVTEEDEDLIERVERLNKYVQTTVTIRYKDGIEDTIGREELTSWIGKDDDGLYSISSERIYTKIYNRIQEAAPRYTDTKDTMSFDSEHEGHVVLKCKEYGYKVSVEAETDKVYSALDECTDTVVEVQNSIRESVDPTFGGTYIEVDITGQHVYYYEDGRLLMDSPCVSGLESDPERRTPSGVFSVFDLMENQTLGSLQAKDESQRYESHVDYWMPFFESYGMHDATWRDEFGGDIYLTAGSHGCVNLPPEFAKKLYNSIEIWTPVIVLRYGDNADAS